MTRKECDDVLKVLVRIKDPDAFVNIAVIIINKQIEQYDSRRGQLREQYETEYLGF